MGLTGWGTSNYLRRLSAVYDTYPFMVSIWGYVPTAHTLTSMACVVAQTGQIFNRRGQLHTQSDGTIWAQSTDGAGNSNATSSAAAPTDQWYHMTGEFIGIAERAALMNGANRGSNTGSRDAAASNSVYIGIIQTADSNAWSNAGALAECSIWDCSGMSNANMDTLASHLSSGRNPINLTNQSSQPWTNKLKAYWLDSANTITDLSGNGHNLSMVGTLSNFASHPTIDAVGVNITAGLSDSMQTLGDVLGVQGGIGAYHAMGYRLF